MAGDVSQSQRGGAGSTNVQIVNPPLSEAVETIRPLVLDVVQAELYRYSTSAQEELKRRTNEIAEQILRRVAIESPSVVQSFEQPDIQFVVRRVGESYGRTGDRELGDVLVDLLADRCKTESRDLMAVVLNDAIETAPRMTSIEMACLTLAWRFVRTRWLAMSTLDQFKEFLVEAVLPFAPEIPKGEGLYLHLQYLGCASVGISSEAFAQVLLRSYPGMLSNGFERDQIYPELSDYAADPTVFATCLHDPSRLQINALYDELIDDWNVADDAKDAARRMRIQYAMSVEEVDRYVTGLDPRLAELTERWNGSKISWLELTSVGMAIAHANYRRLFPEFSAPLTTWVS